MSAARPQAAANRSPLLPLLAIVGAVTLLTLALLLRDGMVAGNDSAFYLSVADNLGNGRGLTTPVGFAYHDMSPAEFVASGGSLPLQGAPPLYSILLAIGGAVGLAGREAAAVLNVLGGVAMVVLCALVTWFTAQRQVVAVLLVAAFALVQASLLVIVVRFVQPDALFSALMLAQVLLVWRCIRARDRRLMITLVAVTASTVLLRQLGLALVGSGALGLLLLGTGSWSRRSRDALVFGAASLLPLIVYWPMSNRGAAEGGGFTQLATHLPTSDDYGLTVDTVREWIAGLHAPGWYIPLAWLLGAALVAVAAYGWAQKTQGDVSSDRDGRLLGAQLGLTTGCYLAVLWLTAAFLDDDVPVSGRYLLPVLPLVLPLLAGGAVRGMIAVPLARRRAATGVLLGIVGVLVLGRAAVTIQHGVGIPVAERTSSVGPFIDTLADDAIVFAVAPEWIYNATGRGAYLLPDETSRYTGIATEDLDAQLAELGELSEEHEVYIVYAPAGFRPYIVSQERLAETVPLTEVYAGSFETVFRAGGSSP